MGKLLAWSHPQFYTLEYMTLERHDADMFIDSISPRDLDSLSMLLNDPAIPLEERISMGRFATHLLRAELHPASVGEDAALLAFLLARWDCSLQDRDADIDDVLEAFEIQLDDASWVLGQSLGDLRAGIARLSSSGVISTIPRGDSVLVTFKPILIGITSKIEQRVYRDFYTRQGRTLHGLAEHHLAMIVEHLEDEEARVDRSLPGLKTGKRESGESQIVVDARSVNERMEGCTSANVRLARPSRGS